MQSYQADSAALPQMTGYHGTRYHLAVANLADEVVGTLARLVAYVGTLALLAILGLYALDQLPRLGDDDGPELGSGWTAKNGCNPDSIGDLGYSTDKSISYLANRHPEGDSGVGTRPKRRHACNPAGSPDWLAGAERVQLRGSL